eukprot:gene3070-3839_t
MEKEIPPTENTESNNNHNSNKLGTTTTTSKTTTTTTSNNNNNNKKTKDGYTLEDQQQQQENNTSTTTTTNTTSSSQSEIIKTFEHLLRKSQRLFAGLRDLPQFGRQWQPFFQKTFELYTKLWKFQQQYRSVLEDKSKYGLKRCEIGEIASKIGQLYYHYYLRTSDTNYLNESFIFYEAIRLRAYFKDVSDSKIPDMMVKQLRYYARFIVVCLLLNRKKVVFELVEELFKHVSDYTKLNKPNDAQEWSLVLQEIFSFLQADQSITFSDSAGPILISHRLNPTTASSLTPSSSGPLFDSIPILQQAILVGNHQNQIKFSEITLDMFRITQSLEYETINDKDTTTTTTDNTKTSTSTTDNNQNGTSSSSTTQKRKNPHKYLLYRPTISQLLLFLSNSYKDLADNKAMLLYLSADGFQNNIINNDDNNTTTTTSPNLSSSSPTASGNITNTSLNSFYSKGLLMNSQKPLNYQSPTSNVQQPTVATTTSASTTGNENKTISSTTTSPIKLSSDSDSSSSSNLATSTSTPTTNTTTTPTTTTTTSATTTSTNKTTTTTTTNNSKNYNNNNIKPDALYPMDLIPFCRKPFFIIVDSQYNQIFKDIPVFNQPFMSLLSPSQIPKKILNNNKTGNLFTFFLHDPLSAFCDITSISKVSSPSLQTYVGLIQSSMNIITKLLHESIDSLHPSISFFLSDDFLRSFILRFIFCHTTFHLHKEFQNNIYQVSSSPPIPHSILYNRSVLYSVIQLANSVGVADQFIEIDDV